MSDFSAYLAQVQNAYGNSRAKQLEQLQLKKAAYEEELKAAMNDAADTQKTANKSAYSDYMTYLNPYGVARERAVASGLNDSGMTQTNLAKANMTYQNRLGSSASDYAITQRENNLKKLAYQSEIGRTAAGIDQDYYDNLANLYITGANYDNASRGSSGSSGGSSYIDDGNAGDNTPVSSSAKSQKTSANANNVSGDMKTGLSSYAFNTLLAYAHEVANANDKNIAAAVYAQAKEAGATVSQLRSIAAQFV